MSLFFLDDCGLFEVGVCVSCVCCFVCGLLLFINDVFADIR